MQTRQRITNDSESDKRSRKWSICRITCLVVALVLVLVLVVSSDLRRSTTTLVIDGKGTIRLGGLVPLKNKTIRYAVLRAVSHLNGGKFTVVADKSASWSAVVEAMDSIPKSGATTVPFQLPAR